MAIRQQIMILTFDRMSEADKVTPRLQITHSRRKHNFGQKIQLKTYFERGVDSYLT